MTRSPSTVSTATVAALLLGAATVLLSASVAAAPTRVPQQASELQSRSADGNGGGPAAAALDLRDPEVVRGVLADRVGFSLGPPGGEVRSLVMAPSDSRRLYLGTSDGHLYASGDGAATWTPLAAGLPHGVVIDNLVVHPRDADVVYAAFYRGDGFGGLIKSFDGGANWIDLRVPDDPSLRALALAPSQPDIVYVGGIGGVWRSGNGGASWRFIGSQSMPFQFVESLAVDPRDPARVYAGTWRQAFRTLDAGATWHRIHSGMAIDRDVFSVTVDPRDPDQLLAGTCNFIYVSGSGGDHWSERRQGLAAYHNRVHVVAHDPSDPERLYAGTRGALYRSSDGGKSWQIVLADVAVSSVVVHPDGLPVYVGTEERGILVSRDGSAFEERNDGLYASRITAFDALPGAPRVLFAARSEGPLADTIFYSTDVGATWEPLGYAPYLGRVEFLRAQLRPVNRVLVIADHGWWSVAPGGVWYPVDPVPGELRAIEIAHDAGGLVLAASDTGLWMAEPRQLGHTDVGVARPFDGSADIWRPLFQGREIRALAIEGDRFLAAGPGRVVAGQLEADASRPPAVEVFSTGDLPERIAEIALVPEDPAAAYAVADHTVFRTTDGGAHWQALPLPWPAAELRAVAIDPGNPDQVLALDYRGALYRGHGDGRYWLILDDDPGLLRAWKLRVSNQAPGLALVATQGHGLRVVALDPSLRAEARHDH